jgi:DNA-binding PadR family transcriptional regulator
MRRKKGVRYALLGAISQNPEGAHGWALKTHCDRYLGGFWQLNFGEIYRVLDRLASEGMIEQVVAEAGSNRKVYRITEMGRQSLDDFVLAPVTDAPRPLRDELAVKLLFANPAQMPELLKVIGSQRDAYMQQLGALQIQRRKLRRLGIATFVTDELINLAELHVQADLLWLDDLARKLKERFSVRRE